MGLGIGLILLFSAFIAPMQREGDQSGEKSTTAATCVHRNLKTDPMHDTPYEKAGTYK